MMIILPDENFYDNYEDGFGNIGNKFKRKYFVMEEMPSEKFDFNFCMSNLIRNYNCIENKDVIGLEVL